MIYSGVDLLRVSGQQQERVARLNVKHQLTPVQPMDQQSTTLDENTQSALLRFARFVNGKKEDARKSHRSPSKLSPRAESHPYVRQSRALRKYADIGQMMDLYV